MTKPIWIIGIALLFYFRLYSESLLGLNLIDCYLQVLLAMAVAPHTDFFPAKVRWVKLFAFNDRAAGRGFE